jgi:hypothetical protein
MGVHAMTRKLPLIELGYQCFLSDGGEMFGAVREVVPGGRPELVVNIENAGDFRLPLSAVEKVVEKRVVMRWADLEERVQEAIRHTLDREEADDEEEVELVPASEDSEDADVGSLYDGPRHVSPPGELPGRDVGSRYGAPPSVTAPRRRS